ncbi:acetate--CoA ligase family protein [Pseudorhodoferax sp.]|uniref:acetate--CoA ligase family protein n=1 Tax=Pseudorhodoferax sp. TaxID=1993553 RepID=UPI002DD6AB5C|nr:acetate--CoA ligase family protein [Pseudorhodoferax sp.]
MNDAFPDLGRLVAPRGIAVVGASQREGAQGRRLIDNVVLHSAFTGAVFPVHPTATEMLGLPCFASVDDLPDGAVDVALVMVNATQVLPVLRQCAARRIPFAVVMTSGFAEVGAEGAALQAEITALCGATGLRVYGPNCPGFVNLRDRIGMTFSPAFKDDLNPGPIGLATQGGGLGRNVLQALAHGPGVGLWFSAGNEADLGLPNFIAHMALDPQIRVIAVLMEGIQDGARLIRALQCARAQGKPVVVLKIGRSEHGIRAAQSHTASIAGSAQVNSAVFRQYGVVEVGDLHELATVSRMLLAGPPRATDGVCIYTFSGGTAALAADLAGAAGLPMAVLEPRTEAALRAVLPAFASTVNPVDTTADILRDPQMASTCLRIVCQDANVGTVVFPIPMDYGEITAGMAATILEVAAHSAKRIVPVWMSRRLGPGFEALERGGLLPFVSLSDAFAALQKVYAGHAAVQAPAVPAPHGGADAPAAAALSEVQAKALLRSAGIDVPSGRLATTADEAVRHAEAIGHPVVMKVVSAQIAHKTEAGGVRLDIRSAPDVRAAWADIHASVAARRPDAQVDGILVEKMFPPGGRELLIGVHRDAAFGPVLSCGLGGIHVEVLKDVTHRAIPLERAEAGRMLREIRAFALLQGVRGQPPADLQALEDLLLAVSDFVVQQGPRLRELDLNPVWVGSVGQGAVPLDALLVLDDAAA